MQRATSMSTMRLRDGSRCWLLLLLYVGLLLLLLSLPDACSAALSSQAADSASLGFVDETIFQSVFVRKPYEKQFSHTVSQPVVRESDQLSRLCPLPLHSHSKQTGCLCQFESRQVRCIYSNRLQAAPPPFQADERSAAADDPIVWSVDMRCKNFTRLLSLAAFYALGAIDTLDLSHVARAAAVSAMAASDDHDDDPRPASCKVYDERTRSVQELSSGDYAHLHRLEQIGSSAEIVSGAINGSGRSQSSSQRLRIAHLNLNSNNLRNRIFLNGQQASSPLLQIRNLSVADNSLDSISMMANIDVCTLGVEHLDLSHNHFRELDIEFLIFVDSIDLSHNRLVSFAVDFLDRDVSYLQRRCRLGELIFSIDADNNNNNNNNNNDDDDNDASSDLESASNTTVTITRRSFVSIVQHIDLSHNRFGHLPFGRLARHVQFKWVRALNASHNRLARVHGHEFRHMRALETLSLEANRIERLEPHAFAGLRRLARLDLSSNALGTAAATAAHHSLPDDVFAPQNDSLELLRLSGNALLDVPVRAFRHLAAVRQLHLTANRLRTLPDGAFGFMRSLLELHLSHNELRTIESRAFSIHTEALVGPGLVEKLDLSHNRLSALAAPVFAYLTNLRYLLLNNNLLRSIEPDAFRGVNYLITLDLSLNQLHAVNFLTGSGNGSGSGSGSGAAGSPRPFAHLRYLKLSNNRIAHVPPCQFAQLSALKLLDLSSNQIRSLADTAFDGLQRSVKRLILNYNRIVTLNACAFAIGFKTLRFVQILYNPLNCTHNCDFFYAVYSPPYAVNYEGVECVDSKYRISNNDNSNSNNENSNNDDNNNHNHNNNNNNNIDTISLSAMIDCSLSDYEKIRLACKEKFALANCSAGALPPTAHQHEQLDRHQPMSSQMLNRERLNYSLSTFQYHQVTGDRGSVRGVESMEPLMQSKSDCVRPASIINLPLHSRRVEWIVGGSVVFCISKLTNAFIF